MSQVLQTLASKSLAGDSGPSVYPVPPPVPSLQSPVGSSCPSSEWPRVQGTWLLPQASQPTTVVCAVPR